jgi:hypothetical protein
VNATRRPSRFQRPERLLPFACIAGAATLFASELMTTFQLSGGTLGSGNELCNLDAASRHHFALGVLALFAIVMVIVAIAFASKPAAVAVAIAGVLALLLFVVVDLPKANNVGTISGCSPTTAGAFDTAKAIPQAGFWLEMVGVLGLALSAVSLATLSPEQLATMRPGWLGRRRAKRSRVDHRTELEEASAANPGPSSDDERMRARLGKTRAERRRERR